MAKRTVLTQLKALDQQRIKLMDKAKTEALAIVEAAIGQLNSLGFNYLLSEGGKTKKPRAGSRKATHRVKAGPCPVCDFETTPPHDGRAHRMQGNKKKPFTDAELTAKGLKKV